MADAANIRRADIRRTWTDSSEALTHPAISQGDARLDEL